MPQCEKCFKSFDNMRGLRGHAHYCEGGNSTAQTSTPTFRAVIPKSKSKIRRRGAQQGVEAEREELRGTLNEFNPSSANQDDPFPLNNAGEGSSASSEPPAIVLPEPPVVLTRHGRARRLPKAYADYKPSDYHHMEKYHHDLSQLIAPTPAPPQPAPSPSLSPAILPPSETQNLSTPFMASDQPSKSSPEHTTTPNMFGLYRVYSKAPLHDPAETTTPDLLTDSPAIATVPQAEGFVGQHPLRVLGSKIASTLGDWFSPFSNVTRFRLMNWLYTGGKMKSEGELQRLVDTVIAPKDFNPSHLVDYSVKSELKRLDNYAAPVGMFSAEDGWREGSVKIRVPKEDVKYNSEADAPEFEVKGIWYRPLLAVIRSAYEDESQKQFHNVPFKLFRRSEPGPDSENDNETPAEERVWTDIFNSDAMLEEQAKIDALPRHPDDPETLEYVAAAGMGYSDSSHLSSFGSAYLWPIYIWMAALSKYLRCKPTSFAAHHIAYIPKLPQLFQDFYHDRYKTTATPDILRFCRSQLIQQIWSLLLDSDFMEAYRHGILVTCGDGIVRRLFPRIITYSADYPERVLMACLRFLAKCPCPMCLVQKQQIALMGSKRDAINCRQKRVDDEKTQGLISMAREWVFEKGYRIGSAMIGRLLNGLSLVPTRSTFSQRFAPFGVNFYSMFVPDLLHEFEIGVFKAFFAHILRVLYFYGTDKLAILNSRFRKIPTFGRDVIRRFTNDVSGRHGFAARDYENVIKVLIVVVEGLLPEPLNTMVLDLVWECAFWHSLAKLRMHTESTLSILELSTTSLGDTARRFAKELEKPKYDIRELPAEEAARHRRDAQSNAKRTGKPKKTPDAPSKSAPSKGKAKASGPKRKQLNLHTFKFHNLRHYVDSIRRFGPTDGYSTQTGELEHRRGKQFYGLTSRKNYEGQIATHIRRGTLLKSISKHGQAHNTHTTSEAELSSDDRVQATSGAELPRTRGRPRKDKSALDLEHSDPLTSTPFREHHHMSDSTRERLDLTQWAVDNHQDPAIKNFVSILKSHLITRLLGKTYTGDEEEYTPQQRMCLQLEGNRFYKHKTLNVNYTSYDLRRDQDIINPSTHSDIMVLAHEDDDEPDKHPYWYARIVGIFHADVRYIGDGSRSMEYERLDFVWVRWFGRDLTAPGGFAAKRLHRIGFVSDDGNGTSGAFGFLDPRFIIRAVHLIPAFHHGRTPELLKGPSMVRRYATEQEDGHENEDWQFYYVNIFVDRDMLMRYLGGGIGHKALRAIVKIADTLAALGHRGQPAKETAEEDMDVDVDVDVDLVASGDEEDGSVRAQGSEPEDKADEDNEDDEDDEQEEYGYEESDDDTDTEGVQDNLRRATEGSDSEEDEGVADEYGDLGFARF